MRTRKGKGQTAPVASQEGQGDCKRQKVYQELPDLHCMVDGKENIQHGSTPEISRVREDDVIFIRKRMSATRKHWATDAKKEEGKHVSPDDVLKLPRSMPTDGEDSISLDGEKRHDMRKKTRSRVNSNHKALVRKYPRDSGSPPCHQDSIDIHSLPDSCLIRIFKLSMANEDIASSLVAWRKNPCITTYPLVCQRWKRVLCSPSEIWKEILIDESVSSRNNVDGLRAWITQRQPSIDSVHICVEHVTKKGDKVRELIEHLGSPVTHTWTGLKLSCMNVDQASLEKLFIDAPWRFKGIRSLALYNVVSLTKVAMQALKQLPDLESLSIRFLCTSPQADPFQEGDGSLSESLLDMAQLKSLFLEGRGIKNIQPAIAKLKNLTELSLESIYQAQSLPLMAMHLNTLTKLSFKGSKSLFGQASLDGQNSAAGLLPGTERMFWMIRSLPKLEELNIDDCGIKEIPVIDGLPINTTLKKLSMNNNPDMVFKKGLAAFQGLESLTMRRCNMPCVSSAITALSHLQYLDISNNGLVECHGLGKLKGLHVLKASYNQFPSIPKDIFSITGLKELELRGCVYLEFSSSLNFLVDTWPRMYRMVVTKGSRGRYQSQSIHWLHKLQECFDLYDRNHVVEVDDQPIVLY